MRRRIQLLVVGMTVLVVLAFAIPLIFLIRNAVAQRADDATRRIAQDISFDIVQNEFSVHEIKELSTEASGRQVSITRSDGTTFGSTPADSDVGPEPGTAAGPPNPGGGGPQSQLLAAAGGHVAASFARDRAGNDYFIRVFESDSVRYGGATDWYLLLGGASVGLLLVGAGAGELITRRIARPLIRTAQTAQQLSLGDTSARAPTDGPREVADVGIALNRLADRIDELIAEERETVADLSHRLRTPLTTLRLDAEALRDPVEAERVGAHVIGLERMLTAVIHAARRPQREGRLPSCDATAVVGERVEFWSALTDEQGRASSVDLPATPVSVRAAAEDLAAAVDALLENVVAHTPEGTAFSVRLTASEFGAVLEIGDAGPGIPEDADVRGRSDRGSSGLGLDIARRCAEASGGSMVIGRSASGGALVTLELRSP